MSRGKQPGHVEIAGGKTYFVNKAGDFVAFDSKRYRSSRPWARGTRRDTREQVL